MTKKIFFKFWLPLTVGMATVVFNSCDKKTTPAIRVANEQALTQTVFADETIGASGVTFTTTGAWSASIPQESSSWLAVNQTSGSKGGEYTIIPMLSTNTTGNDRTGMIIVLSDGTEITITITQSGFTAEGTVPIAVAGMSINGVMWATRNVDAFGTFAATSESSGMFYQWNRQKAWSATEYMVTPPDGWDDSFPTGTEWEKANDPCPFGWRVPIHEELQTLLDTDKVTSEWTDQNGVTGRTFTDNTLGNSIFLPAAGASGSIGRFGGAGTSGNYWSRTQSSIYDAYNLRFDSDGVVRHSDFRSDGASVRCVAE